MTQPIQELALTGMGGKSIDREHPGLHRDFLIHGEYSTQRVLANLIQKRFGLKVFIPDYLEEVTLKPGEELRPIGVPEKAAPAIPWSDLLGDLEAKLTQLRTRKAQLDAKTREEQADLRDRILELNRHLGEIISKI